MPEKKTKVKLGLKSLAMLPSYIDYIFVHLKQKERLRPELSPKFLPTLVVKLTDQWSSEYRMSLTKMVDSALIPSRFKRIKVGIHSFPA